jgi:hypothetical protein
MTALICGTDRDFLDALETCTLPPSEFGHAAHVRAAYLYAREHDFAEALGRMRRALRAYTAALGKSDRYHETITTAFVALIAQRLHEHGDEGGWDGFARAHADLFDRDVLRRYIPASILQSDLARQVFVLPRQSAD